MDIIILNCPQDKFIFTTYAYITSNTHVTQRNTYVVGKNAVPHNKPLPACVNATVIIVDCLVVASFVVISI